MENNVLHLFWKSVSDIDGIALQIVVIFLILQIALYINRKGREK